MVWLLDVDCVSVGVVIYFFGNYGVVLVLVVCICGIFCYVVVFEGVVVVKLVNIVCYGVMFWCCLLMIVDCEVICVKV